MRRSTIRMHRRTVAGLAGAALVFGGMSATGAIAAVAPAKAGAASAPGEAREITPQARKLPIGAQARTALQKQAVAPDAAAKKSLAAGVTPPVGTERTWFVLDDARGQYVPETFTLRAVGSNIETWVENDLNYPEGDCRNNGADNVVTDAQVADLNTQFDTNILPKGSDWFSIAPARDGSNAQVGAPGYYSGDGNKTVALISNVRDANFYDPTSPDGATYIGGFFSSTFNAAYDRNVMTIDSFDWAHRTGANPPNNPGSTYCDNRPARPHLYEGTFAHEYQHLLESYTDNDEGTWLNEGLSDYAQTIVGYVNTRLRYPATGADGHINCFEGWSATAAFPYCGAENSLTLWEDQGSPSVLSDYGAAYSMVTYLQNHFGKRAIRALHNDKANGLTSVQNVLDDYAPGLTATDVVHDWQAGMVLDGWLDRGAKGLKRDDVTRFSSRQLKAGIDWAWSGSYDSPGAPPNGADYVLAKDGRPVTGRTATSLTFDGNAAYPADAVEWTVAADAHGAGDPALWGGEGDQLDRSIVYGATVPATGGALSFDSKFDIEQGWDFGLVQISTDGGKSYKSLSNADTTSTHDPAADAKIVAQLPGFSGEKTTWAPQTFDLSAYAGKQVLVAFRYMTDAAANGNGASPTGWWVDNVTVGTTISQGANLDGARTITQIVPISVAGWSVQVVGWSLDGRNVAHRELKLKNGKASLSKRELRSVFRKSDRIGVIVGVDDPTESASKYAGYNLKVNSVLQPGGALTTSSSSSKPVLPLSTRSPGRS